MKLPAYILFFPFIIFLSFVQRVNASFNPDAYIYTYITSEQGMAQNTVDYIYKDSRGFMWFATWNGLNRFNGYEFIRYDTQSEEDAINSLFIRILTEDNFNQLWVGTDEGVNIIDIYSGKVKDMTNHPFAGHRIFTASINALMKDNKGRIWIGYHGGLALVSIDSKGEIENIDILQEDKDINVYSLFQDDSGVVWIGYNNGIKIVTSQSEKVIQIESAPGTLENGNFGEIFVFFQDGEDIWIGTGLSLLRYNKVSGTHKQYTNDPQNPHSILQNYVRDIAMDNEGHLILATFRGLSVYIHETDDFIHIENSPEQPGRLNNNFVNSLFIDSQDIIWIGTEKGGVNKMKKKEVMFDVYRHNSKQASSLSPYPVNAIFEDSNQNLWIGTVEGGLNKRISPDGRFIHYRHEVNNPRSLRHNVVSVITEGDGYLWIGTWGGGISCMKLSDEGRFDYLYDLVQEGTFSSFFISGIVYDKALNALWIATLNGMDFYDIKKQTVTPVLYNNSRIDRVSGISLDSSNRLWIGTENGLFCLFIDHSDMGRNQFVVQNYRLTSTEKRGPLHEKVNCIFESKDHSLWFGTNGRGLYKLVGKEDNQFVFTNYGTEVGLSDNVIYAIEEDEQGHLWLSTNMGLSYFIPEKGVARAYYASDGLSSNQFYWAASCHTTKGELLFGNVDGAVIFNPSQISTDTTDLIVSITGGKLYNEPVDYRQIMNGWNLREQDKSFSIEFSSLYYTFPEKIKYMYMLDGFDKDWTEIASNRRFANYTNLPPGKYVFKVRSTNPGGEWSDQITSLPVNVIPPFYKRGWFITMLLLAGILLIYYINEMKIRNLRRQKIQLEKMVDERTLKIEKQKDELARQTKDLEMANVKLNQATQDKINFFTNITHEFKTPLTLVLGPIEQALKLSKNPKVIEQLKMVRNNSNFLLSLINQLMDFRKADSGNIKINKTTGNFEEFIHALIEPFHVLIKGRNIELDEHYHLPDPVFRYDADLLQKVVVNLLSNSIKFTPDDGCIQVYAALLKGQTEGSKMLYLSVNDSGPGISDENKELIFDRFYQVKNQTIYPVYGQSGTGIGLFLCKQIIELLGGTITVKDSRLGGTTFRIVLPLDKTDFEVDETYGNQFVTDESFLEEDDDIDIEKHNKPLLLIVEDNPDMRAFIRSVLENDFRIKEAVNGEAGLEKTLKYLPDFIVADIMMPKVDGLEFCRKVKNNFTTSHIPVLLLTAKSSTEVRIEGYKAGAAGYIAKPFDAELLIARIQNILESKNSMHKAFDNSMDVKSLDMQEESQDRRFLDKLMEVIEENYKETSFDVSELIEKMHMSKSLLHKKLHSLIGQSAVKIIRSYRLTKAKELMETAPIGQMNVSEIAYAVGFNDPKYFTRCFTKQFGIAPSNYIHKG